MSMLSELEGSQIFIFETNYYTQKVSNKTCNQTKKVTVCHLPSPSLWLSSLLLSCTLPCYFFPTLILCCPPPRPHYLKVILLLSSSPRCRWTFPFLTLSLSSPLFWVFLFFSYPPCHFSLLSSAPSLESAVFRSSGLLHCWLPSKLCPLYLLSFLKVSQKNNHPHNLMSQSASTMIVRSFNKILV